MEAVGNFFEKYYIYCVEVLVIVAILVFALYLMYTLSLFKKD